MTKTEAYDLACTKVKDPAVVEMGGLCVIGEWVPLSEYNEVLCILVSKTKGVKVIGLGTTWSEAVVKAGLVPVGGDAMLLLAEATAHPSVITNTRMATVEDLNPPPGTSGASVSLQPYVRQMVFAETTVTDSLRARTAPSRILSRAGSPYPTTIEEVMTSKKVTVGDFLTEGQLRKCAKLKTAKLICEEVIKPNIEAINRKLGQENDPMYLAYMVEYLLTVAR